MAKIPQNFEVEVYKNGKKVTTIGNDDILIVEFYQVDKGVRKRVYEIHGEADGNELITFVSRVADYSGHGSSSTHIGHTSTIKQVPDNVSEWIDT